MDMLDDFVADAIIAYLQTGNWPAADTAELLDRMPLIDMLRQRITKDDLTWLIAGINHESDRTAGLACSLLRKYSSESQVKKCFEAKWNSATPYLKNRLMWRLLDDPKLPVSRHREFFNLIRSNWDVFRDFNRQFYGPGTQATVDIKSRLEDDTFPASKKWIYLCCVAEIVEDKEEAKAIVNRGLIMDDDFTREVALTLLSRLSD